MKKISKYITTLLLTISLLTICSCKKEEIVNEVEPPFYTVSYFNGEKIVVPSDDSAPWFVSLVWENDQYFHRVILYTEFIELFPITLDVNNYQLGNKDEIIPDGNFRDIYYCYRYGEMRRLYSISSNGTIFYIRNNNYYYLSKDLYDGFNISDYMDENAKYFDGLDLEMLKLYYDSDEPYVVRFTIKKDEFSKEYVVGL